MLQRVLNPKNISYKNYGGRGIRVCKKWRSFDAFLKDMGRRPSRSHSLDRENNDGHYTPKNCRWATRKQQNQNRRTIHSERKKYESLMKQSSKPGRKRP